MTMQPMACKAFDCELFDERLLEQMDASRTGFHFEEGGCWGMAAALFDAFAADGLAPTIRYSPDGFVHAWVYAAGFNWDYKGRMLSVQEFRSVASPQALCYIAATYGVCSEEFEADRSVAFDLVTAALCPA